MLFIELTHSYSGQKVYVRADTIHTVRDKDGKTLVLSSDRGQYVDESPKEVVDKIEKAINSSYAANITIEDNYNTKESIQGVDYSGI